MVLMWATILNQSQYLTEAQQQINQPKSNSALRDKREQNSGLLSANPSAALPSSAPLTDNEVNPRHCDQLESLTMKLDKPRQE